MDPIYIYVIGTAGSGKSMLTGALKEWMDLQGYPSMTVNLDPGAESLPYTPDFDIRDHLKLADVMAKYGLGPNGAQIVAADMLYLKIDHVREATSEMVEGYVILDTPGQMELFTFRQSSRLIIDALRPDRSVILFLFDPFLSATPIGFITLLMLSATTHFRFMIPMVNILSKVDLIEVEKLEQILLWMVHPDMLYEAALAERPSMEREMGISTFRLLEDLAPSRKIIPVSAAELYGLEDIYDFTQEIFMGGEDLDRHEDSV